MPPLAAAADAMPRSGIRRVMDLAWSLPGPVLGLHVGEPSFPTPAHVLDGARAALDRGETRYGPNAGIGPLRAAIAEKVGRENGIAAEAEQVVVTAGGMEALFVAFSATVSAGDDVLVPDPGWPNFAMAVGLLGARPVPYALAPEHGFRPDVAALERLVGPRTRVLVVNSPSNPLGSVLEAADAAALCRFAERHDLWLISDECYDAITFEAAHASPAAHGGAERTLSCFSFSKTYAMTGMRVGYVVAPPDAAATVAKLQEPLIACVNVPAQHAALAALTGPQDVVAEMREAYRARRDAATALLQEAGVPFLHPQGAFYLWVDVSAATGGDVEAWALDLLRERSVAVAPGTTFGAAGEGWARLSLATAQEDLLEGLRRLTAFRRPASAAGAPRA